MPPADWGAFPGMECVSFPQSREVIPRAEARTSRIRQERAQPIGAGVHISEEVPQTHPLSALTPQIIACLRPSP